MRVGRAHLTGALASALLAANVACTPDPPAAEDILAAAEQLPKPQPGLYRSVTRLTEYDLPQASPQDAAAMRERFAALQPTTAEACLTPAEAEGGWAALVRSLGEGSCQVERFTAEGDEMQAMVACTAPGGVTSSLAMTGAAGATASTMELRVVQHGEAIPGGEQVIGMTVSSERIGDCPPQPVAEPAPPRAVGTAPNG